MPIKHWDLKPGDDAAAGQLAKELKLPLIVARVLFGRGYDTAEKMAGFFQQSEQFFDPFLLKDMDRAVTRIRRAIENGERIAIYGDYDCDGIMATVLLYSYLESVGADICYYIPQRDKEGYGLNLDALKLIRDDGVGLVVTVDNGITAIGEVEYASSIGLDIVITDHHKPREVLPEAVAVVDPHRLDDESGCDYLAGVGVAFKLVCALEEDDGGMMLDRYGDIVAVATIADIVPLVGENRLIVRRGLQILQNTDNEGLAALIRVCGMADKSLSCEQIAYGLVPRINSAGRFDSVDSAIELFVGEGEGLEELASGINSLNEQRRAVEDEIVTEILAQLENDPQALSQRVVVIHGENWHHGIVGIVASRMVERFGKPCIVLSVEGDTARGSARSVEGFSIIDAINACSQYLVRYGGHNQAAGLTVRGGELENFIAAINEWAAQNYPEMPQQTIHIDCEVSPNELEVKDILPLSQLEPFGSGNELPVFAIRNCTVQGIYPIGDGKHLRLRFAGDGTVFFAVYFGMTQKNFPYAVGEVVDLAVTVDVSEWNGEQRVSIKVKDIHLSGMDYDKIHHSEQAYQQLMRRETPVLPGREALVPDRDDIAVVYRYLRAKGNLSAPDEVIYAKLSGNISCLCKVKIAIDVLDEMQLITRRQAGGANQFSVVPNPARVDISQSRILKNLRSENMDPACETG
ncbi:single-stranded-DNA-specific exonuclease RecJ [Anaerotruncus rubiinfantis]|uniref:single-stranded-DNA-specific exonuclease RecJ n=1 Tax=Anaerotruncus rubiinfantis TaxID=1720200 RepID=UPI00082ED038|nr:single-stranded-DNA-specific exonuclease RecJ [Anaerotruncus rubiinfantis]